VAWGARESTGSSTDVGKTAKVIRCSPCQSRWPQFSLDIGCKTHLTSQAIDHTQHITRRWLTAANLRTCTDTTMTMFIHIWRPRFPHCLKIDIGWFLGANIGSLGPIGRSLIGTYNQARSWLDDPFREIVICNFHDGSRLPSCFGGIESTTIRSAVAENLTVESNTKVQKYHHLKLPRWRPAAILDLDLVQLQTDVFDLLSLKNLTLESNNLSQIYTFEVSKMTEVWRSCNNEWEEYQKSIWLKF